MATPPDKLPTVVSDIPRDLRVWTERVRETLADVQAAERATNTTINYYGPGGGGGGSPTWQPGDPLPCGYPVTPSAPANLRVDAGFGFFSLTWDAPAYCGHSYTEVYGLPNDDLGAAVLLGSSVGTTFSHVVTEPGAFWYFWLRHVNVLGLPGPYNQTQGTGARTALDPDYLLDLLQGQITESQLFTSLAQRIDGIEPLQVDMAVVQDDLAGLSVQYTVKIDAGNHIAGFGLASTPAAEGGNTSRFIVRADEFAIAGATTISATAPTSPYTGQAWLNTTNNLVYYWTGSAWSTNSSSASVPFIVRTAPTIINGETVPAGVYLTDAYIGNGTIGTAKIGNAAITDAKILSLTASKLTAGTMAVNTYIQSGNYNNTTLTGWKLWTDASGAGYAEFNGGATGAAVTVRGTIYADKGWFKGCILGGAATQYAVGTGFYAGVGDACATTGTYKWRVGTATDARVAWDGTSLIVRGTVQADQGWFKGCILGGDASQYAVGTGLYAGFGDACATSGTYKFRVGTTAQQRMLWDGSKLEVYDSSNTCVMRIGAADSFFLAKDSNGVTRVRFGSSGGDTPGLRIYDPSGNVVLGPDGNYNGIYLVSLSVNTPAINNLAVTTAKIDNLAVTNAKIANLAVTNAKIADLAVTTAKIDNLAVTNAKIDNAAVGTLQVADGAVTTMNYGETVSTLTVGANSSVMLAGCTVTMPAGSTGLVGTAWAVLNLYDNNGLPFNTARTLTILKNGTPVLSYTLFGGTDVLAFAGFDSNAAGTNTYSIRLSTGPFYNPAGNVITNATVQVLKSYFTVTGGKR